jgi:hypothetical protein
MIQEMRRFGGSSLVETGDSAHDGKARSVLQQLQRRWCVASHQLASRLDHFLPRTQRLVLVRNALHRR